MHVAPAQQVQVNMKNGLSRRCIAIHDNPIALLCTVQLPGQLRSGQHDMPKQFGIAGGSIVEGRHMLPGDDQYVVGSLRGNIAKSDKRIVFKEDIGGDVAADNVTEKACHFKFSTELDVIFEP
jgi:hypothetical protein